jgi:hypothetical protein
VSVLSSVSKLIFNLAPGTSTEVVGLFDMDLFAKGKVGARSLHMFVAEPRRDDEPDAAEAPTPPPSRTGTWILAALLGAGVAAMGTALAMDRPGGTSAGTVPSLTVVAEPATAEVRINGQAVASGHAVQLPGEGPTKVTVSAGGYTAWNRTLAPDEVGPSTRIFVRLDELE